MCMSVGNVCIVVVSPGLSDGRHVDAQMMRTRQCADEAQVRCSEHTHRSTRTRTEDQVLRHHQRVSRTRLQTHTNTHADAHTHTHTRTQTHTHTQRHTRTQTHTHTHTHTQRHTHTETHTRAHTHARTHTHARRHTHTQRHTRAHTHTGQHRRVSGSGGGLLWPHWPADGPSGPEFCGCWTHTADRTQWRSRCCWTSGLVHTPRHRRSYSAAPRGARSGPSAARDTHAAEHHGNTPAIIKAALSKYNYYTL